MLHETLLCLNIADTSPLSQLRLLRALRTLIPTPTETFSTYFPFLVFIPTHDVRALLCGCNTERLWFPSFPGKAAVSPNYTKAWMPVMALPRMSASGHQVLAIPLDLNWNRQLTVNITLTFVRLCHEQVRNMSTDVVLVADSVATEDLLQSSMVVSGGVERKEPGGRTSWR